MGTTISPKAVVAVYYNSQGEALQQEFITDEIRDARMLAGNPYIPDQPPPAPGTSGGCPGTSWPCMKPGNKMGCCG